MIELIDDWGQKKRVATRDKAEPASPKKIQERLATFQPGILNVYCFADVGYPWVQVVFNGLIHPDVALQVGDELAAVAGPEHVYLNSLRPSAVYFVLEPAFDPKPDLEASRYGTLLAKVKTSWNRRDKGITLRSQ